MDGRMPDEGHLERTVGGLWWLNKTEGDAFDTSDQPSSMSTQAAINKYCSYFEGQLEQIRSMENRFYQKILFVVMFDTWARARYPNVKSNKNRFVSLIRECADWAESERVSLPQLSFSLQSSSEKSKLAREIERRFSEWQYGRINRLNMDPLPGALEPFVITGEERQLIEGSQHAALFYTYRNHLVHEFREPGYGMELSDEGSNPYYHGMTTREGYETWELVYPIGFFSEIANRVLFNLRIHLETNSVDPYSLYEFGSVWNP